MDVYLFGAGASAAEGAPATANLLEAAWRALGSCDDEPVQRVWRFLERVFGVAITAPESFAYVPSVDQLFGLIDWSILAGQGLGALYDPVELARVRRDLEDLICATLAGTMPTRTGACGPYDRFVRRVLEEAGPGGFAAISLNYDTLLDTAFARAGHPVDYGLRRPDLVGGGRPLLLKLHGSLNWAICRACDHLEAAGDEVAHLLPKPGVLACSRCGNERMHGVIISPTWAKGVPPAALRHLWDLALEAIQNARRLVLVGYSLPPADVAIYHLIRRGMLTRTQPVPLQVGVVNHRTGECGDQEEVCAHFRRLFGSQISFDFSGFVGQTVETVIR